MTIRTTFAAALATITTALTAAVYFNRLSDFSLDIGSDDLAPQLLERNDD